MSKIKRYIENYKKYAYLLRILVKKEIQKKYKNSVLGILWSLLSPLLDMIVLSIVFSTFLKQEIDNYPVFLLSARLLFGFFASGTDVAMHSIVSNAEIIKKIYVPKYIFVIAKVISDFIIFLISLIDLVLLIAVTKHVVTINVIYTPLYLISMLMFVAGFGLILSTLFVFFRDLEHLYGIFITAIMYASVIFYPASIIPAKYEWILTYNPLYYFITGFRDVVYYGKPIDPTNIAICFMISLVSLIIGLITFAKKQDKFIYYL